jgi:hypothetical protein
MELVAAPPWPRARSSIALLVAAASVAACSADRTEVVVVVSARELAVPTDIDELRVTINDRLIPPPASTRFDETVPLCAPDERRDCFGLPLVLTLIPGDNRPRDPVTVDVQALLGGAQVMRDEATFTFRTGASMRLDFILFRACVDSDCAASGSSCSAAGRCEPLAPTVFTGEPHLDLGAGQDRGTLGAGEDGGTLDDGGGAPVEMGPPPHEVVQLSAANGGAVHLDGTLQVTAALSNLQAGDSGRATFSASSGTFSNVSCTAATGTSTCTAVFTPGALGMIDIAATSVDDGATGSAKVDVVAPLTVSFNPPVLDLLAFGSSPPTAAATATVSNALPGESQVAVLALQSGTSAQATISGASVTVSPAAQLLPAAAAPAPTVVRATSVADASKHADLTVNVHAWVDESPALAALFPSAQMWTAAIAPSGDVIVAGRATVGPPKYPVAAVRSAATGQWSVALQGFNGVEGGITSATVDDQGQFVLAGVTNAADTTGNQSLLVLRCSVAPSYCKLSPNLAAGASVYAAATDNGANVWATQSSGTLSLPVTVNPVVNAYLAQSSRASSIAVSFTAKAMGTCDGTNPQHYANVWYRALASGGFTALGFIDDTTATTPMTSCPFTASTGESRSFTGSAINASGGALWLGGFINNCATTGCAAASVQAFDGLVVDTPPAISTFRTYQADAATAGVDGPVVKRGYDDALLAISSIVSSTNFVNQTNLLWYPSGLTPTLGGTAHTTPPSMNIDVGVTVGGGAGGSPWSGGKPDLFFSVIRRNTSNNGISFHFGWQHGSDPPRLVQSSQTPTTAGFQLLDLAFAIPTGGTVEGWALGQTFGAAGAISPFVAHLK